MVASEHALDAADPATEGCSERATATHSTVAPVTETPHRWSQRPQQACSGGAARRAHTHTHTHTQAMRSSIGGGAHARGQTRIQRRTDRYPTRDCAGEHTRTIVLVHVIPAGLLLAPQLGPPLGACRIGATASLQKPVLPLDKRGREAAFPACHHQARASISSSLLRVFPRNPNGFCGGVGKTKNAGWNP